MDKSYVSFISLVLTAFTSCIGIDIVPEESISTPQLMIDSALDSLKVGENFQLTATVIESNGNPQPNAVISWNSLTPDQIKVTESGLMTALTEGKGIVTAKYSNLVDSLTFYVGQNTVIAENRIISFSGKNGYEVNGSGNLKKEGDEIILEFNSDFSAENGPGLVVYLSNNAATVQGGIELKSLLANKGSQSYNVTKLITENGSNVEVRLNTYNFVIIYCKPFGVLFGVGNIQN